MENRARRSNVEFHQLRRQAYEEELNRATQDVIITYLENRQQQLPVEDSLQPLPGLCRKATNL